MEPAVDASAPVSLPATGWIEPLAATTAPEVPLVSSLASEMQASSKAQPRSRAMQVSKTKTNAEYVFLCSDVTNWSDWQSFEELSA
jgi:hypothetical protein